MRSLRGIMSWATWPTVVVGLSWAAYQAFGLGYDNNLVFLALAVLNLIVILALEQALPLRKEWSALDDRAVVNDLGHTILAGILGANIGHFIRTLLFGGLASVLAQAAGRGLWPVTWPLWAQMVLAVVLVDFVFYWQHRMFHHLPVLWRFHALHHNPERMHVLKSARLHAGEVAIRFILIFAPLAVLGAPKQVLLWYALFDNLVGNLAHANIKVRFPAFVHRLLVTPGVHHLHHAQDLRLGNGNFGGMLSVWDAAFGTFFHPDDHPDFESGIADNPIPAHFLKEVLAPLNWRRLQRERMRPGLDQPGSAEA